MSARVHVLPVAAWFCAVPLGLLAQAPAGQLDGSASLFGVLAAINAAGYDADLNSPTNHPLRAEVRRWIAARNPGSLAKLRRFVEAHRQADSVGELSQYVSFALSVDGPPAFKPRVPANQIPTDAASLGGLSELLTEFWNEAQLEEAWHRSQPALEQAIARYHVPVTEAIFQANAYMRNPTSGARGRRFQIYLDLLGAPNQVHSRSYGDEYFVVVTPSPEPRIRDIRHAYLHYVLDPLAMRSAAILDKKKALGEFALASPLLDEAYRSDFVLLAGMCLVKAVEARLEGGRGAAESAQAMREGFILTGYFYEALSAYEKQEQALRLYAPQMFEAIDLAREDKRIAQIEFASKRTVRTVKPAPAPEPERATGVAKEVEDAEQLYARRELPAAKEAFRKVLEKPAARPVHAKAYYGLARIAALEKNPELAQQLFERTLELDPEPFERAWTHVYLARLAKAAREPEAAVKHYQAALAVQGASEGARKAAETELPAARTTPESK